MKLNSRLLTERLARLRANDDLHQDAEGHLSKLVHLRAGQEPISDARTATYVILSIGSGPGGRRFKSFRPDHYFLWFAKTLADFEINDIAVLPPLFSPETPRHVSIYRPVPRD